MIYIILKFERFYIVPRLLKNRYVPILKLVRYANLNLYLFYSRIPSREISLCEISRTLAGLVFPNNAQTCSNRLQNQEQDRMKNIWHKHLQNASGPTNTNTFYDLVI